jgi:zinc D-Ala-D-Ala carboxypeptidase
MFKEIFYSTFFIFLLVKCQSTDPQSSHLAQVIPVQQTQPVAENDIVPNSKSDIEPNLKPKKSPVRFRIEINELMGKFDPAKHSDFEKIPLKYCDKDGMLLRRETLEAFKKMHEAAEKDGISLKIISATRNFERQKAIWEAKWEKYTKDFPNPSKRALKILEYSSMPGTSRHHWGTDMDLNDLNNPTFEKGGKYEETYLWLVAHAHEYGFCQPYSSKGKDRPNGYNEEKWHWTYLPLSKDFLVQYLENVKNTDLAGFKGAETAIELDATKNYVGGINKSCQKND